MRSTSLEGHTFGKYRVLEPLGRGGMARVYRAFHPQLERYVAIKVMRADLADDEEFLARFRREAKAVAGLRHANIVQVFDFDVQDDIYYMVMELLEGDTLKTRLNDYRVRGEQMPWGEMMRILLDVLDGLAYAHSEAMIHRDIKPANILLTKRGEAVIGDFGIAQIIGGTRYTASGMLIGTLEYIAPEQGMQNRSDARSDIYSLGIVFYEMLTQCTPFNADTPLAILMKHVNDPLPLPRTINAEIPEPFERVVLKALAKKPEDRYQGAADMARALRVAAEEAEIALPSRISLPLSFTTESAPSDPVAIFSGTTRNMVADAQFADDDTDVTLGQHLDKIRAEAQPDADTLVGEAPPAKPAPGRRKILVLILQGLAIVALGNLAMFAVAASTGRWAIFEHGWPIEIFLVCLGLSVAMYTTASIWVLVPLGIIFGTGALLAYSTVTGNWDLWVVLWLAELLAVAGSIAIPITLAKQPERARALSRLIALMLGAFSVLMILIVGVTAVFRPIWLILIGLVALIAWWLQQHRAKRAAS